MIDLSLLLQPLAVVLGIGGAALVASPIHEHQWSGFTCWLVANALWVWHGVRVGDVWLIVLFGVYWILAAAGWQRCRMFYNVG